MAAGCSEHYLFSTEEETISNDVTPLSCADSSLMQPHNLISIANLMLPQLTPLLHLLAASCSKFA